MEGSFKAWRSWERNDANEVVYNQPAEVDRHVDRLTDSGNMISNVQTTPWHWYSVQGLLKWVHASYLGGKTCHASQRWLTGRSKLIVQTLLRTASCVWAFTRYNLSDQFFCIHAMSLWEFQSDETWVNKFQKNRSRKIASYKIIGLFSLLKHLQLLWIYIHTLAKHIPTQEIAVWTDMLLCFVTLNYSIKHHSWLHQSQYDWLATGLECQDILGLFGNDKGSPDLCFCLTMNEERLFRLQKSLPTAYLDMV